MANQHLNISENILKKILVEQNCPVDAYEKLIKYSDLLLKWNKSYNLTAHRTSDEILNYHLLDSLLISPSLNKQIEQYNNWQNNQAEKKTLEKYRLIDIGSGGGLPGIPMAILFPQISVTLLDSNQKKTSFLRQVVIELKLENIQVITARVEDFQAEFGFHLICSRAFASLEKMLELTKHLQISTTNKPTRWCAMKGKFPSEEIKEITELKDFVIDQSIQLQHPTLEVERCLLFLRYL